MKYIITESQHSRAIGKFITYQMEPHEVKISEEYPDSRFWVKDGQIIAEVNKKRGRFYLYDEIWDTISRMFSLDYDETQQVMRNWLEEHYKLGSLTPTLTGLGKWYKLGGLTPSGEFTFTH